MRRRAERGPKLDLVWTNGPGRGQIRSRMHDCAFYFPGLNTYLDERVHVGPARFGHMAENWAAEARRLGVPFARHRCVGPDGLAREIEAALESFDRAFAPSGPLAGRARARLVGHSTGGLVARAVACLRPERTADVVTLGAPHAGTSLAAFAIGIERGGSPLNRLLRAAGYDLASRVATLADLAPEGARDHALRYPVPPEIPCAYVECVASGADVAVPFRALAKALPFLDLGKESDGLISSESQRFGERLETRALDHYGQFGVALQATPAARARCLAEFRSVCERLLLASYRSASV